LFTHLLESKHEGKKETNLTYTKNKRQKKVNFII
jgi:hypothetical protein